MPLRLESITAIDIGAEKIKIVKSSNGTIKKSAWMVMPDGVINQSRIESLEMLTDTIKKLRKSARIGRGKCALCLSGEDTVIRHIYLPHMEQNQIYKNVITEISGYLPVNPEQFNIDYRIQEVIGEGTEGAQYKIMVVATPKDKVEQYIKSLKNAGLRVKYVDTAENAYEKLMRHLSQKGGIVESNFLIVDFGATKTNVIIYKDGGFFANRILPSGTGSIIDAVSERLSINKRAAERILTSKDMEDRQDEEVQAVLTQLDPAVSDIIKVLDFFQSRNSQTPIGAIYIAGGFSKVRGMCAYLSEQLRLTVHSLPERTRFMHRKYKPDDDSVDYSAAIAVTLREVVKK